MKRFRINFEYFDDHSRGNWKSQSAQLYADGPREAVDKTIDLYGLGIDCQYRITGVIDLDKEEEKR